MEKITNPPYCQPIVLSEKNKIDTARACALTTIMITALICSQATPLLLSHPAGWIVIAAVSFLAITMVAYNSLQRSPPATSDLKRSVPNAYSPQRRVSFLLPGNDHASPYVDPKFLQPVPDHKPSVFGSPPHDDEDANVTLPQQDIPGKLVIHPNGKRSWWF